MEERTEICKPIQECNDAQQPQATELAVSILVSMAQVDRLRKNIEQICTQACHHLQLQLPIMSISKTSIPSGDSRH